MKHFQKGDIVEIFKDYQNNTNSIGTAKLLRFVDRGLPFSLDDEGKSIYNTECWEVDWVNYTGTGFPRKLQNLRYRENNTSYKKEEDEEIINENSIQDRFLEIDGEQIY